MSTTRQETTEAGNVTKDIKRYTCRSEYFTEKAGDDNRRMVIHRADETSVDGEVISDSKVRTISKSFTELKAREAIDGINFAQIEAYLTELSDLLCAEQTAKEEAEEAVEE